MANNKETKKRDTKRDAVMELVRYVPMRCWLSILWEA